MSISNQDAPIRHRETGAAQPLANTGADGSRDGDGTVVIFGLPRSGTTWLAKIFDSHPDVLCRYEPDRLFRGEELPGICLDDDRRQYVETARRYLRQLADSGFLGIAGPLPFLPKRYRSPPAAALRIGLLYAFGAVRHLVGAPDWLKRLGLPDLVRSGQQDVVRTVIKSVSLGRARLFAEAWLRCRIVVIMRHPCGQVESEMRGVTLGKFTRRGLSTKMTRSARAAAMGLKVEDPDRLSQAEQLAWHWAFWNQIMLEDFGGSSRAKVVRYEDLAAEPLRVTRELFDFAGLSWHSQTEEFIDWSTSRDQSERYFQVVRDPDAAASKWRSGLSAEDQERILGIARRVPAGMAFAQ